MTQHEIGLKELYSDKTEEVMFAGKVPVTILEFRRHTHDFENGWENEYLNELANTLKPGMVVFDIGAEQGEFTAMAAKIVGCENVHIFEPSPSYWTNIKRLWDINGFKDVGGLYQGYVSDNSSAVNRFITFSDIPDEIFYGTNHVVPSTTTLQSITIDNYCDSSFTAIPDIIMMDIEGAELSALRGALKTMQNSSPIFFISIHTDEMITQRSNGSRKDIHDILKQYGYNSKHINTDHEEHWKFENSKN